MLVSLMVDTGPTWEVSILRLKECLGFIVIFILLHPVDATEPLIEHMGKHNLLFPLRALGLLQSLIHRFSRKPKSLPFKPQEILLLEWRHTIMFEFLILGTLGMLSLAHLFYFSSSFSSPFR